ncbi:MAG: GAF domain-containing sensor histidine kinase [Coleofasciculaceae cyanobacterium]
MYIPASSEFVALCQSQVTVLKQGLGAALTAVYLTEQLASEETPKLIPVVVYPETDGVCQEDQADAVFPEQMGKIKTISQLPRLKPRQLLQPPDYDHKIEEISPDWQENSLGHQRQIVLPLIHEGVVMGLLVTSREDRAWNKREKATIERIARTLSLAYFMDQRRAWYESHLTERELFQEQQRDLLHNLMHQFRNPITALGTFGKLLLKRLLPEDKNQEIAASIVRESARLQELLQQFNEGVDMEPEDIAPMALPASKTAHPQPLPTKKDDPEETLVGSDSQPEISRREVRGLLPDKTTKIEPLSLEAILEPLLISARAIAEDRHLKLHCYIPKGLPPMLGDARKLREALSNLIDNALKYTPAGGQIEIQVGISLRQPQEAQMAISISDNGQGIPSQDLERLFERYYRGEKASTDIPGSGLGLAIAQELIEQMQGDIEVFSPAKPLWVQQTPQSASSQDQNNSNLGTTFVVWLPIKPDRQFAR